MHLFSKKLSTGSKQNDNLESGNVCQIIEIGSVSEKENSRTKQCPLQLNKGRMCNFSALRESKSPKN